MGYIPVVGETPPSANFSVVPGYPAELQLLWPDDESVPAWRLDVEGTAIMTSVEGQMMCVALTDEQTTAWVGRPWLMVDSDRKPRMGGQIVRWNGSGSPPPSSYTVTTGGTTITVAMAARGPAGPVSTEPGPKGDPGPAFNPSGSVPTGPPPDPGASGDFYLADDTGHGWVWVEADGDWLDVGQIRGPQGPVAPVDQAPDVGSSRTLGPGAQQAAPGTLVVDSFQARTQATSTVPFLRDDFDRADGPLGPHWIDGHDVMPTVFDPLGIYGGKLVCTDGKTRPGTYDTTPPSGHPPTLGRLHPGIGCAWRETGSKAARVKGRWSAIYSIPSLQTHVEFAPLVHVVPGHPLHGFGVWMSELFGNPALIAGYICNPPEDFAAEVVATAAMPGTPAVGAATDVELVADGTGNVQCFIAGSPTPVTWSLTVGGTSTTLTVDADLKHSTLHGFAVDAHFTTPANIPTTPSAEWVEIEAKDPGTALSRSGGTVLDGMWIAVAGSTAGWRFKSDGFGGTSLGLYATITDTQPKLALGTLFGAPAAVFAGPGGSTAPSGMFSLAAAGLNFLAPITGRVTPRVGTVASSATPSVNSDNIDLFTITAQTANITSMSTNLTGTPTNGQRLVYRIKDNGIARTIAWGAKFASGGDALPTTTVLGKVTRVDLEYDTVAAIWRTVTVKQEP